jgi:hypothetical protein
VSDTGLTDNGPPGPRPHYYYERYYGAYVLDGNNLEAVCHQAAVTND